MSCISSSPDGRGLVTSSATSLAASSNYQKHFNKFEHSLILPHRDTYICIYQILLAHVITITYTSYDTQVHETEKLHARSGIQGDTEYIVLWFGGGVGKKSIRISY